MHFVKIATPVILAGLLLAAAVSWVPTRETSPERDVALPAPQGDNGRGAPREKKMLRRSEALSHSQPKAPMPWMLRRSTSDTVPSRTENTAAIEAASRRQEFEEHLSDALFLHDLDLKAELDCDEDPCIATFLDVDAADVALVVHHLRAAYGDEAAVLRNTHASLRDGEVSNFDSVAVLSSHNDELAAEVRSRFRTVNESY